MGAFQSAIPPISEPASLRTVATTQDPRAIGDARSIGATDCGMVRYWRLPNPLREPKPPDPFTQEDAVALRGTWIETRYAPLSSP